MHPSGDTLDITSHFLESNSMRECLGTGSHSASISPKGGHFFFLLLFAFYQRSLGVVGTDLIIRSYMSLALLYRRTFHSLSGLLHLYLVSHYCADECRHLAAVFFASQHCRNQASRVELPAHLERQIFCFHSCLFVPHSNRMCHW